MELWKEIDVWPEWFISTNGRLRNKRGIKKTTPNKARRNYRYAYHSSKDMKPRAIAVHRLVARHFIENPNGKPCVNHKDNNTQNNNVSNLEWCTHAENTDHARKQNRLKSLRGSKSPRATLTEQQVSDIKKLKGKMTYVSIAEKFNTKYSNIAHIMRGSRWGHIK